MRMASKSATGFAISNGLERNMFLRFPVDLTRPPAALHLKSQFPILSSRSYEKEKPARASRYRGAESECRGGQCFKTFLPNSKFLQHLRASPGSAFCSLSTTEN